MLAEHGLPFTLLYALAVELDDRGWTPTGDRVCRDCGGRGVVCTHDLGFEGAALGMTVRDGDGFWFTARPDRVLVREVNCECEPLRTRPSDVSLARLVENLAGQPRLLSVWPEAWNVAQDAREARPEPSVEHVWWSAFKMWTHLGVEPDAEVLAALLRPLIREPVRWMVGTPWPDDRVDSWHLTTEYMSRRVDRADIRRIGDAVGHRHVMIEAVERLAAATGRTYEDALDEVADLAVSRPNSWAYIADQMTSAHHHDSVDMTWLGDPNLLIAVRRLANRGRRDLEADPPWPDRWPNELSQQMTRDEAPRLVMHPDDIADLDFDTTTDRPGDRSMAEGIADQGLDPLSPDRRPRRQHALTRRGRGRW